MLAMFQQALVFTIVALSGVYVSRYLWSSLKEVWNAKKGCGGGCANCAFAPQVGKEPRKSSVTKLDLIPLTEVKHTHKVDNIQIR